MEKKWLNKNELKEYVGFSIGKIDNMMRNNEISYSKVGKSVRFDKNEVDNLLKSKVLLVLNCLILNLMVKKTLLKRVVKRWI